MKCDLTVSTLHSFLRISRSFLAHNARLKLPMLFKISLFEDRVEEFAWTLLRESCSWKTTGSEVLTASPADSETPCREHVNLHYGQNCCKNYNVILNCIPLLSEYKINERYNDCYTEDHVAKNCSAVLK